MENGSCNIVGRRIAHKAAGWMKYRAWRKDDNNPECQGGFAKLVDLTLLRCCKEQEEEYQGGVRQLRNVFPSVQLKRVPLNLSLQPA
jgi:hypothetical protein